jgi:hypothetical protein
MKSQIIDHTTDPQHSPPSRFEKNVHSWVKAISPDDHIQAIICVGRKSSHVSKEIEGDLVNRNLDLFNCVKSSVHDYVHPDCKTCEILYHSIVINGVSSNENFATFSGGNAGLKHFRGHLNDLQDQKGIVIVAIFGKDGLTTNTKGFCQLFTGLTNMTEIRLAVYLKENDLRIYAVTQIIEAISNHDAYNKDITQLTEEEALVGDWYGVMINKEE